MCRYIKSATEPETNAFDENGYYKTGDMARLEGDNLFILGRASLDGKSELDTEKYK